MNNKARQNDDDVTDYEDKLRQNDYDITIYNDNISTKNHKDTFYILATSLFKCRSPSKISKIYSMVNLRKTGGDILSF
jgi:hypothetical protein